MLLHCSKYFTSLCTGNVALITAQHAYGSTVKPGISTLTLCIFIAQQNTIRIPNKIRPVATILFKKVKSDQPWFDNAPSPPLPTLRTELWEFHCAYQSGTPERARCSLTMKNKPILNPPSPPLQEGRHGNASLSQLKSDSPKRTRHSSTMKNKSILNPPLSPTPRRWTWECLPVTIKV